MAETRVYRWGGFCSVHRIDRDRSLLLVSEPKAANVSLLFAAVIPRKSQSAIADMFIYSPDFKREQINPRQTRLFFDRKARRYFSEHLLLALDTVEIDFSTLTEKTVWLYENLIEWGESSPASLIAQHENAEVGAVRARLAQARLRGLLESPGHGVRGHLED
jgi:hypothetical protein